MAALFGKKEKETTRKIVALLLVFTFIVALLLVFTVIVAADDESAEASAAPQEQSGIMTWPGYSSRVTLKGIGKADSVGSRVPVLAENG